MVRLALALALVAACSIPDVTFVKGDDIAIDASIDAPPGRTVTARWTLNHRQSATQFPCPASAVTAAVLVNPWDPNALIVGSNTQTFTAKCSPTQGTFMLPAGIYVAHMVIQDSAGTNLLVSDFQFLDTTVNPGIADFSFYDDAGFFVFAYGLLDHAGGARLTCAEAGISNNGKIELVSTPSSGPPITDQLICDHHVGSTKALPPGSYTFQVRGREAGVVVTTTVVPPPLSVLADSVFVFQDNVEIPVH